MSKKFETIYRPKNMGKGCPRVGLASSIMSGDVITFFIDHAFHTRVVDEAHHGYVVVEPLKGPYGVLDGSRKVVWSEIAWADRPVQIATSTPTSPPEPEPLPEPDPLPDPPPVPDPLPEPPPPLKTKKMRKPKPVPSHLPVDPVKEGGDLWALLTS